MRPYRCQICGETYLGMLPADRCPFCGAAGKNLLPAAEWVNYSGLQISEESQFLLTTALELEVTNAAFYTACAKGAETQITQAIFKRLAKQELEHAEVFADLLGVEPTESQNVTAPSADLDKFTEAHQHEASAIKYYLEAAQKAVEPRVQQVFRAISEIESEHLIVSNLYK